jgi:hypothetical protein
MPHRRQEGIPLCELLEHCPCVVGRSIVNDNDLVANALTRERRGRLLHEQRQILSFVTRWHEDAHVDTRRGARPD